MQIYLARNNVQAGPYTLEDFNKMLLNGEVIASDLMWHVGMSDWQTVGACTKGQSFYAIATEPTPPVTSFGDNVDFRQNKRPTVADLYGDKSTATQPKPTPKNTADVALDTTQEYAYASILSRFLAMLINMILVFLAFFPFLQQFLALSPDLEKMNAGDMATRIAYAQELAQKMDPSATTMSMVLLVALVCIQSILLAKKGQSIGKVLAGIRIIDIKTGQKPATSVLLGVRGALLVVIYWVSMLFGINTILLGIHYLMAVFSPNKQGWHDKLAGTTVIKAKSNPKTDKSKSHP